MNIFTFHNYYQIPGGEDKSHQQEIELLKKYGHEISEFNFHNNSINSKNLIKISLNSIWSIPIYKEFDKTFSTNKPDLIICQNFFPLISPSLFFAAKNNNIPIILFLRNYRLFCLNGFALLNGIVCKNQFFPILGVINKCYRNNTLGSTSVALMLSINRLFGTWKNKVDAFVTLSNFAKNKFIEAGLPKKKIFVRQNFLFTDPLPGYHSEKFFLTIGRFSTEKGILEIIDLWKKFDIQCELKIIGGGPLEEEIISKIRNQSKIELIGFMSHSQVIEIMKMSYGLIMNSKWYEGMPRVLIEAFATATPVIVPDLGVFQEMVFEMKNGLLFSPGNEFEMLKCIKFALTSPNQWFEFGNSGRKSFIDKYSEKEAYQSLINIYEAIK